MHRKTALLAFVASALVASGIGPAAAQKQTLKMAYWAGPSHHMVQTQEAWAKTIFDASGGNLVIEVDKAPLAKPDGQYDIVKNGVRDLVWHVPGYTAGRFDLFQAPEQPFLCPSSTVCSTVLWKWYAKHGLGGQGVHRHHAGDGLHDRAVRHPSRQAGAHAGGDPGAQDPRRRRQRAGGQGARLVGGGPAGDRRLRDAAARRGRRHGVSLGGGQQLPAQRARQVPSRRCRAACSPRPS